MDNPWKVLDSKEVYDNKWINVTEHQVINPGGNEGIYGQVSFKNLAIGVIPIDSEGYTYLVGQYRFTLNAYSWEIPEGGAPLHSDPIETAHRELREETGLLAGSMRLLCPTHTSNSVTNELGYIYIAEDLTQGPDEQEDTEAIIVKKVHLREALAMVFSGEITDAISQIAILWAAREMGI